MANKTNKIVRAAYPSAISGTKDNPMDKFTYEFNSFPSGTQYVKVQTGNADQDSTYPWVGRIHVGYTGSLMQE